MNQAQQQDALQLAKAADALTHVAPESGHNPFISKMAALLRAQHARIEELEAELVKQARRTAEQKLRYDQISQQHDTQAALNREAREQLAALKAAPQAAQAAVPVDIDLPDVEDMAHSAVQEALSHGVSHDVFHRWMRAVMDKTVAALSPTYPAEGVPAQEFKANIYQALGIGSACNENTVFVNIENLKRRAACLSAVEIEFFMIETLPDESEGDTEPGEECMLNWGHTPDHYVKRFAEALAATPAAQAGEAIAEITSANHDAAEFGERGFRILRDFQHLDYGTKLYAHPAPQAQDVQRDAREFPEMTPELASILGLMCFQCISFAQALRAAGHQINTRAEDEQAAVLHWMLGHWFKHGENWREHAQADMERMKEAAIAASAAKGGEA